LNERRIIVDLNKLSTADKVIGVAAIVFLISLFLPWYGLDFDEAGSYDEQGWDYFLTGVIPFLVIVAMVAQIAMERFSTTQLPRLPVTWGQAHVIAGGVVLLLVLLRVLITADRGGFDLDRQFGLWIALLAAIGVAAGGYLKSKEHAGAIATA
jgi:hypothetical protein